ncbi:MAG: biotin--[acetyl-CoA-carboxylase] ligase, partial [Spirochaetales bacterium]|nr:biotin--[acetyl-CoA-carboxylase] ligase [Spirochaetales bacterium]
ATTLYVHVYSVGEYDAIVDITPHRVAQCRWLTNDKHIRFTNMTAPTHRGLSPDDRDRYIIERLRSTTIAVSGQTLAAELGISRVACWKRVEALRAWGYGIDATRKGYILTRDDGLSGWDVDAPGPLVLFDTVESTMDEARTRAVAGAPSGTTVLALSQRSGRGIAGGQWSSPSGGLYLSFVIRSQLPPSHAGALSLEASATTISELRACGVPGASFRWPNMVVVDTGNSGEVRKVGGVLVEAYGDIAEASFYIVGVGLAVPPDELTRQANTRAVGLRATLAATIVRSVVSWASAPDLNPARWNSIAPRPDTRLNVVMWNGATRSIDTIGYDNRGNLVSADGRSSVSIGECHHVVHEGVV